MTDIETLKKGVGEIGVDLGEAEAEKFLKYKELLLEWNEKINITAITDEKEVDIKHFLDSLTAFTTDKLSGYERIIDIGTGGGFPGIPLKIINKDLEVTLLDSLNKRIIFLQEVIKTLGLTDIEAVHGRAEELSRKEEYREQYDICISRAVASLDTLSEYCLPFVTKGGYFIAMKGPDVEEELNLSKKAIDTLGGKVEEVKLIEIPESDITHSLIIIKKVSNTPKRYPRGGGKPKKQPL